MQTLRTLWGQRIITARRAAGLTQVQLAAALGVPQQTISQWERGVAAPRDDRRPHLARALGISPAELFAYPDGMAPQTAATKPPHGTLGRATAYGCRCAECRTVRRAYDHSRSAKRQADVA